ncbi:MAG: NAD+ synthase [Ignavibacteriaceae bacterium]|nr:NAD+ synthase [Ignavibacteriaceae bacterium]
MKIAVCQINTIIGDLENNKRKIVEWYKKAEGDKADLVIFPELCLVGYPPLDLVEKKEFRDAAIQAAHEIALITGSTGLIFGSICEGDDHIGTDIHNSAFLCYNGKIQFIQHKSLIPNYDIFDEMRYFDPSKEVRVHEFKGEKLGISICEDIWNDEDYWYKRRYVNDPIQDLLSKGASLLINISASPYSYGKREDRKKMLSVLTGKDKLPLAYVCCTGAQTDLIFDGASMCFDSKGNLNSLGKSFQEDYFIWDSAVPGNPITKVEGSFEEEVLNALIYGVREYSVKMNLPKALIGLSGGIDSAIVTYIAIQALGNENVHVVLMPSQYSSSGSVDDSLNLIDKLGISYDKVSITPVFESVLKSLNPAFGYKPEGLTEENIQARIRGLYLMALSNKHGYLLLTTGNKSEMGVGYCTLYGDMCGGLAVIADVYKTDIYRIANYINREQIIIPQDIIDKPPSAELKPGQTDQDSLPPYEILDKILRMYLEENKEVKEISEIMGNCELVKKILSLVDKNEFKRKQAAPALRVSRKAFGFGRRYPIVQGWRR